MVFEEHIRKYSTVDHFGEHFCDSLRFLKRRVVDITPFSLDSVCKVLEPLEVPWRYFRGLCRLENSLGREGGFWQALYTSWGLSRTPWRHLGDVFSAFGGPLRLLGGVSHISAFVQPYQVLYHWRLDERAVGHRGTPPTTAPSATVGPRPVPAPSLSPSPPRSPGLSPGYRGRGSPGGSSWT